jgi:hypothetical protein
MARRVVNKLPQECGVRWLGGRRYLPSLLKVRRLRCDAARGRRIACPAAVWYSANSGVRVGRFAPRSSLVVGARSHLLRPVKPHRMRRSGCTLAK